MNFHPLSELFPLMQGREFDELVADVKANGLREPIWMYEGQILDGRNRWRACEEAKLAHRPMREYTGDDAVSFVVSLNLHRRHLSETQRSDVAASIANMRQGERTDIPTIGGKSISQAQAAELLNVSVKSVERAAKVQRDGVPELRDAMRSDRVSVSAAAEVADLPKEDQRELVAKGEKEIIAAAKRIQEAKKEQRRERQRELHAAAVRAAADLPDPPATLTDSQITVTCDALITDPPYGILDEPWEPSELESFTRDWAERWNDCGAKCALIFWSQRHLFAGRKWFDESLSNYEFQQLLVWHYPNNKSPQSRRGFKQTWEPIYFYRRRDSEFNVGVSGDAWGDGLNDFDCHVAAVPQSNFNDADRKVHPAQKPVSVFRWLINAVSQPGELICDPFAGSGTSGVAAVQLGRRYHGIEIDEAFLNAARERVAAYGSSGLRAA